ncbi:MAG: ABC transporter substrate-binding protein [Actinomycetota bacterium]
MTGLGRMSLAAVAAATLIAAACGDDIGDGAPPSSPATVAATATADDTPTTTSTANADASSGSTTTTVADPPELDLGRIVVIGEDFLLADVLAVGGRPVAATTTLDGEFSGIDRDTSFIEALPALDPDLERLAALEPDVIITTDFITAELGEGVLDAIAEVVVVEFADGNLRVRGVADALGVPERADALIAAYEAQLDEARTMIPPDLSVSMATVYPTQLAVWSTGPVNIPQTFLDLGFTLDPGEGYQGSISGRVYISEERLLDLDAPTLVLMQNSQVEGEQAALAALSETALWNLIPAVIDDEVLILDRLGYPGIEGRTRLIEDIVAHFAA